MTDDEFIEATTLPIPKRRVALFGDGEQLSEWETLNPDGSTTAPLTVRESKTVQVLTVGVSLTPDGPLVHAEIYPNGAWGIQDQP